MRLRHPSLTLLLLVLAAPLRGQGEGSSRTAPALPPISLSGEVRVRSEVDAPNGGERSDPFTLLRSRLGIRVDPSATVSLFLQAQDSRVLGTEGLAPGTVDRFDLHQGWAQLATPWRATTLTLRAGRQEIAVGNERLVGAVNWSNTGRSFDGARVLLAPAPVNGAPPWETSLFAAEVVENGRRYGSTAAGAARPPDHVSVGAYARAGTTRAAGADLTLLYDAGARYRTYVNADRATLDARGWTPLPLGFRVELEGAAQSGTQSVVLPGDVERGQQVRAWLLGGRVQRPIGRVTPIVGADLLSGDDDATDARYTAFSTMFGTNHGFYGLIDVIGEPAAATRERGLHDLFAMLNVAVAPSFAPHAELHRFSLATGDDRSLGTEGDLVAPLRVGQFATVELGAALFRTGSGAAAVGLGEAGRTRTWFYTQLRAGF